jgi:hypothetical protein
VEQQQFLEAIVTAAKLSESKVMSAALVMLSKFLENKKMFIDIQVLC